MMVSDDGGNDGDVSDDIDSNDSGGHDGDDDILMMVMMI